MPFAFTEVQIHQAPTGGTPLLIDDTVALNGYEDALAGGQVYLIKSNTQIVDLGEPVLNSVQAHGAHVGDELCIFAGAQFTCTQLNNTASPQFTLQPTWQADIQLTPINTTTVRIYVSAADVSTIAITIYPNGVKPQTVYVTNGVPQLITLNQPTVELIADIKGHNGQQRAIISYAAGNGPGRARSHIGPGRARSHIGPITSGDGRVILYPPVDLDDDVFLALQTVTSLPDLPPGVTPIGRAYFVRPSEPITSYTKASIAFEYLGFEVLASGLPEQDLTIYYWDGSSWQRQPTVLNTVQNIVSAPLPGQGIYALMVSIEITLHGPGWNLFSYPVQGTKPITEVLQSIAGSYTTVYSYEPTDASDPWKIYDVNVPGWVNDLHTLRFGRGYWIRATESITLYLNADMVTAAVADRGLPTLPTTYYGAVLASQTFVPSAGMSVVAYVNGRSCGQGQTREVDGQIVYAIDVWADGLDNAAGCGMTGSRVTFQVGSYVMENTTAWDNMQVWEVALSSSLPQNSLYLPLVTR